VSLANLRVGPAKFCVRPDDASRTGGRWELRDGSPAAAGLPSVFFFLPSNAVLVFWAMQKKKK